MNAELKKLILSTCMSANMDFLCHDLADYLAGHLDLPVQPVTDVPWQERERMLDQSEIDLCWICGLPYVRKVEQVPGSVEPLVAPVMAGHRYQGLPVYFSDVVVRCDSPIQQFADVRGATWAYNEPNSHSGYGVVLYMLTQLGETLDFFGKVVESGAHQSSLALILQKEVDASAIDSTVLEMELFNDPEISSQIRVIGVLGPSPIPPWVVSGAVPPGMRSSIMKILTSMHTDPQGIKVLKKAHMARFVPVRDEDYEPIRRMARIAFERLDDSPPE